MAPINLFAPDKTSICGRILLNREKKSWDKLKNTFNIKEPQHFKEGFMYSWDNQRHKWEQILIKLYMFYMTKRITSHKFKTI